jgi:hypothetical protein
MQMYLLQKKTTQKLFSQTKKDTDSLVECRDDSSFWSRWTDNLTKWSTRFDFDDDLQKTMVYIRAFSGRNVHITPKNRALSGPTLTNDAQSKAIDSQLIRSYRASIRAPIFALMGDRPGCGQLMSEMLKCEAEGRSMPDMKRLFIPLVRNACELAITQIPLALKPLGELESTESLAAYAVKQQAALSAQFPVETDVSGIQDYIYRCTAQIDPEVENEVAAAAISKETFQ